MPSFSYVDPQSGAERRVPLYKRLTSIGTGPDCDIALPGAPGVIGVNFDPSHLFWQQADPVAAIRSLGPNIFHVHAKDCRIDRANTAQNGVLDYKSYTRELERSWIFRTVGYGNDAIVWKDIVSNLRLVGYDHVLSIEHEDSIMSPAEGLKKAVEFLRGVLITQPKGEAYWA